MLKLELDLINLQSQGDFGLQTRGFLLYTQKQTFLKISCRSEFGHNQKLEAMNCESVCQDAC